MAEMGGLGRPPTGRSRKGVGCLLALGLCGVYGLAGCSDPRISLDEFLEMQAEPEPVPTTQPATPDRAPLVDQFLTPYRVGPDDVLVLTLTGPDGVAVFLPLHVRVDRDGQVDLPLVGEVHVGDRELQNVEDAVRSAYVPKVLKDVAVHAELFSSDSTNVLVVGAVTVPGLVKLRRTERNLLFALASAGGVSEFSSGQAVLRRIRRPDEQVTLDLTDPLQLEAALALAPLEHGDIITVLPAKPNTIFVGGLVNAPHPQVYPAGVQLTVLQAIAAANGLRTDVTPREATLIRRLSNGEDVHVKINLDRVTSAKDPNITLAAGDILWVPDTPETRVQDWINRNIFIRAGMSVNYNVSGVEFLNRRSLQGGGIGGGGAGGLQDQFDPFGFLGQNTALQQLQTRPPAAAAP